MPCGNIRLGICIGLSTVISLFPHYHLLPVNNSEPHNFLELERAEEKLLSFMNSHYSTKSVNVGGSIDLHTITVNSTGTGTPMLLLDGYGFPSAGWVVILDKLAEQRPVYCLDLPGWGLSSRVEVQGDAEALESFLVEAVEAWRKSMGLERLILVGFSLGGFVATSYTMRYQERVQHLVLLDPWGLAEKPEKIRSILGLTNTLVISTILTAASEFNVYSPLRSLPTLGRWLNRIAVTASFEEYKRNPSYNSLSNAAAEYVYQSLKLSPTGEDIFRRLNEGFVYAKDPLLPRMQQSRVPTLVILAEASYIVQPSEAEFRKHLIPETKFEMLMINGTKHNDIKYHPETPIIINSKVAETEALYKKKQLRNISSNELN